MGTDLGFDRKTQGNTQGLHSQQIVINEGKRSKPGFSCDELLAALGMGLASSCWGLKLADM